MNNLRHEIQEYFSKFKSENEESINHLENLTKILGRLLCEKEFHFISHKDIKLEILKKIEEGQKISESIYERLKENLENCFHKHEKG